MGERAPLFLHPYVRTSWIFKILVLLYITLAAALFIQILIF